MNYFELIQAVSKIKLGEEPTLFSEISGDEYHKITDEINNALEEIFLNDSHNFRRKDTSFSMTIGQQNYDHDYGVIVPDGLYLTDSDGDKSSLTYTPDYQYIKIRDTSTNSSPTLYTIYNDELLFYPTPDEAYTVNVAYITDNWAKNAAGTEKLIMELEDDEPNFPGKYHSVLKLKTLTELYYGDPARMAKYNRQYEKKMSHIIKESRLTLEKQNHVQSNIINF